MAPMDFTKATQEPVTDGAHTIMCESAVPGVTANGNLKIEMRWRITASHAEENVKKALFDRVIFTDNSFWRVVLLVDACQLDTSAWQGLEMSSDVVAEIARALTGEVICCETKIKAGSGVNPKTDEPYPDRAEISKYLPYGSTTPSAEMFRDAALFKLDRFMADDDVSGEDRKPVI